SAAEAQANGSVSPPGGSQTTANFKWNFWAPANRFCLLPATGDKCDFSVHISQPGRFPADKGPFGHNDLGGVLITTTADIGGAKGADPNNRKVVWGRSGSWEGHSIPFNAFGATLKDYISVSKYRSTGARCAR